MWRIIIIATIALVGVRAEIIGEIGGGYSYYRYTEPSVMKSQGNIYTLFAKLGYLGKDMGIEANYAHNFSINTKYFGSRMNGAPLNHIPQDDKFWSADVRFGKRMDFINYDGLAYIGVGYRYLKNLVHISGAYTREQAYYYIPVGFWSIDEMLMRDLFIRYGFEFRYVFLGTNKTHIGEGIPGANPGVLNFTQRHNLGFRVTFGGEYKIASTAGIFVQFSADYWYIRNSDSAVSAIPSDTQAVKYEFYEPRNTTVQFAVEVGLSF